MVYTKCKNETHLLFWTQKWDYHLLKDFLLWGFLSVFSWFIGFLLYLYHSTLKFKLFNIETRTYILDSKQDFEIFAQTYLTETWIEIKSCCIWHSVIAYIAFVHYFAQNCLILDDFLVLLRKDYGVFAIGFESTFFIESGEFIFEFWTC